MARPTKTGLDYYPMDVGFLRDKKVRLLRSEFGASSVLFVLYVLGKVYEGDGYFLAWDKDELLLAADELREPPAYISEVLNGCLKRSFFDERVFQMFAILTSAGIQRRYLRGCEKRDVITIFDEYWLLNIDSTADVPAGIRAKLALISVTGGNNGVNSPGNPEKSPGNPQSKGKESKGKERRGEKTAGSRAPRFSGPNIQTDPEGAIVFTAYKEKIGGVSPMTDRIREQLLTFLEAMGPDCCVRAMDEAVEQGKINWKYVKGILEHKQKQGVRSITDWDKAEKDWESKKPGVGPKDFQADAERIRKNNDWLDSFLSEQEGAP